MKTRKCFPSCCCRVEGRDCGWEGREEGTSRVDGFFVLEQKNMALAWFLFLLLLFKR